MPRALHNEYSSAACHTITRLGWTISDKDYRRGEYFQELVSVVNSSTSVWQRVAVTNTGGSWSTGNVFVAKTSEAYSYDADGNLTSDGRWTYAWDAENRLINMTSGSSTPTGSKFKMDFAYDWKGRRIEKQVSTNNGSYFGQYTNRYVYDGWNLVAELNSTNGLIRGYVWGLDLSGSEQGAGGVGGLLALNDATNGLHFCGYDGNGNLAVLTKATDGTVSANYEYGPFGLVLRSSGAMAKANPFRFSSKYHDDESDQLYYGYRFYNPSAGRWLSRDPIEEKGGINIFAFGKNDAINGFDKLGLRWTDEDEWRFHRPEGCCFHDGKILKDKKTATGVVTYTWRKNEYGGGPMHMWLTWDGGSADSNGDWETQPPGSKRFHLEHSQVRRIPSQARTN